MVPYLNGLDLNSSIELCIKALEISKQILFSVYVKFIYDIKVIDRCFVCSKSVKVLIVTVYTLEFQL